MINLDKTPNLPLKWEQLNTTSPNSILVRVLSPACVYYWTFSSNSVLIPEFSQTGSAQNYSLFWLIHVYTIFIKKDLSIFISQIQKYHA